jgi:uncharacterized membrane protein
VSLRLRHLWTGVRSSFWFVPALMVVGAVLLASLMIYLDDHVNLGLANRFPRLFGANTEGARSILSTIAGSMITVAGVTFSVTIVALSLASNQYTPRILRNYMRDRGNQLVLGMFVSVFVYCVLVLRTIRGGEEQFIPSYALLVGMALALAAIGFLIYFIHHIAASIQASTILANIYLETIAVIDDFPRRYSGVERTPDGICPPAGCEADRTEIAAQATGYLQDVNEAALVDWANQHDVVLEMVRGVGDFVIEQAPLLRVYGRCEITSTDRHELARCYDIANDRTIEQDPAYGLRQIVDIALKALSPGINDSTTAAACVDYLGAIVFRLALLEMPSELTCSGGRLRLVARRATFEYLLDLSFNEIRQHARTNLMIQLSLVRTLTEVASAPGARRYHELIWRHVCLVAQTTGPHVAVGADQAAFNEKLARAASAMHENDARYRLPPRYGTFNL